MMKRLLAATLVAALALTLFSGCSRRPGSSSGPGPDSSESGGPASAGEGAYTGGTVPGESMETGPATEKPSPGHQQSSPSSSTAGKAASPSTKASDKTKPATWNPGEEESKARIITPRYAAPDVIVADVVATDWGADPTGVKDSTAAINAALSDCYAGDGGTVWLPAGKYKVTGPLYIHPFVTLRGDWQDPDVGREYGTIILAHVPESSAASPGLFNLSGSAGVVGMTVYYPDQSVENVRPYPFTFYINGQGAGYMLQSIVNCTVLNGYRGVGACVSESNAHEMLTIETLKGTFLSVGAEAYNQADVGTWKNVTIDNTYWANAGAGLKAADRTRLDRYTRNNTVGLRLGDLEWTEFSNIRVSGCKTGIHIVKGKRIQFAGSLFDVAVSSCDTGLLIDDMDTRWGMLLAKGSIAGSVSAVVNNTGGVVKMADMALTGAIKGNYTRETASLSGVKPDHARQPAKPASRLFVVAADPTGKADISGALQQSLTAAGVAGGGVVYLPAGQYRMEKAVSVPAGVELRGASTVAQREQSGDSSGTLIHAYYGQTSDHDAGRALITLEGKNAGVRGVRFVYPDNNFLNGVKPHSFTIRGKADGVYAVNIGLLAAYNGIDFRGCDNHLVKAAVGCVYNNMITAGGKSGMIEGCLQNGNAFYRRGFQVAGWPSNEGNVWAELFDPITRANTELIRLSGAQNQTVLNTFAYGVKTLVVSRDSTNVQIVNVGADNIGANKPLLATTGGSLTGVNIMRYNGISYTSDKTALRLYNRLSINDKTEPTVS